MYLQSGIAVIIERAQAIVGSLRYLTLNAFQLLRFLRVTALTFIVNVNVGGFANYVMMVMIY